MYCIYALNGQIMRIFVEILGHAFLINRPLLALRVSLGCVAFGVFYRLTRSASKGRTEIETRNVKIPVSDPFESAIRHADLLILKRLAPDVKGGDWRISGKRSRRPDQGQAFLQQSLLLKVLKPIGPGHRSP
jgi:hypothetical protein